MTALAIFASTFAVVFLLGLQSLNVNGGHYTAAFVTSFGIGTFNLVLYKTVPDADLLQMAAFLLGGPFGIVAAMWSHKRTIGRGRGANIDCGEGGASAWRHYSKHLTARRP